MSYVMSNTSMEYTSRSSLRERVDTVHVPRQWEKHLAGTV